MPPPAKPLGNKGLKGFTLAEVLVTLGIIGVVSAMTVPSLVQNYQRQSYVTQLHKVYNELQQAFVQVVTENNAIDLREAGLGTQTNIKPFLQNHFKVVQIGELDLSETPWGNVNYKNINGADYAYKGDWACGACATVASGAQICLDNVNCYGYSYGGYSSNYGYIFVDVNGKKGPNIIGRDAFLMTYWNDGVIDLPKVSPACRTQGVCDGDSIQAIRAADTSCASATTYTHQGCFGKILNDNLQMTY